MEDAATAEISRAQLWQWIRHPEARFDDGTGIDADTYRRLRAEIVRQLTADADPTGAALLEQAARLMDDLVLDDDFAAFLTLEAYEAIS